MSGPWDRPSSSDPDDRDSDAQERESTPDHAQSAEPWSPTDPWGEQSRASDPGWDVWPPPSPPSDDLSDPASAHDLWAESWEEEAAAFESQSPSPAYEPAAYEPPGLDATAEVQQPGPAFDEPEPYEPEPYEPEPEPEVEPTLEPTPGREPMPEAVEPDSPRPEPQRAELYRGEPYEPEPHEVSFPGSTPADQPMPADRPTWAAAAAADDVLPDWLAEPLPQWPEEDLGANEPATAATGDPGPGGEAVDEAASQPAGWLDAGATTWEEDAAEPTAPFPIDSAEVGDVDEEAGDDGGAAWAVAGAAAIGAAALPDAPVEPGHEAPEREPEPEPEPESVAEPQHEPEPEAEPEPEPEEIELEPEPEPEAETYWPPPFLESDESTRVLPTDWTPPPVAPLAEPESDLEPQAGEARTTAGVEPEADAEGEGEPGSSAEQAVPWLIGLVLLLAGMVIVLLALIFAGDGSLGGGSPTPSASLAAVLPTASARPSPSVAPSASSTASSAPTATPDPAPVYGPLEMIYQGRAAALAPIYLLLHDFTTEDEAMVLAQDPTIDVRRFAWAPDGTVGAGLLADVLVSIEIGESKRNLGEGLMTLTFGDDASTVYAVRVTADGGNDTATVLSVDFISGESAELASVSYARPNIGSEPALQEAQFSDEGGTVRLLWMNDGSLRLWVLGASTWTIDPESGETTDLDGDRMPRLLDPDGTHFIELEEADDGKSTTLHFRNVNGNDLEATTVDGLVSHVRWASNGDRIVFTVGRSASGGGVLQDLFLWDLDSEAPAMQITNTGAAFGAEWRGTSARWEDAGS